MNIQEILSTSAALHPGHVAFKNGFHGNGWVEKSAILRSPKALEDISKLQAEHILRNFPEVEMLLGPIVGGAILVSHVVRHINKPYGIILGKQPPFSFHEINIPKKESKVVIVEDIISSGTDMASFIKFSRETGLDVLGASVWMNRQSSFIEGARIASLMPSLFELYEESYCPLCVEKTELRFKNVRE